MGFSLEGTGMPDERKPKKFCKVLFTGYHPLLSFDPCQAISFNVL